MSQLPSPDEGLFTYSSLSSLARQIAAKHIQKMKTPRITRMTTHTISEVDPASPSSMSTPGCHLLQGEEDQEQHQGGPHPPLLPLLDPLLTIYLCCSFAEAVVAEKAIQNTWQLCSHQLQNLIRRLVQCMLSVRGSPNFGNWPKFGPIANFKFGKMAQIWANS